MTHCPMKHALPALLVAISVAMAPLATVVVAAEPTKFVQGIKSMHGLSPELRKIRTRMFKDADKVSYGSLQKLADAGDGFAATIVGRRILDQADAKLNSAAVHYFAIGAYNGRPAALGPLIRLLRQSGATLEPSLLSQAEQALVAQARHHQPAAIEALIRFYGAEPIFGADRAKVELYLSSLAESGRAEAALDLGLSAMAAGATEQAIKYLEAAVLSTDLGTRVTAENLLRQLNAPTDATQEAR